MYNMFCTLYSFKLLMRKQEETKEKEEQNQKFVLSFLNLEKSYLNFMGSSCHRIEKDTPFVFSTRYCLAVVVLIGAASTPYYFEAAILNLPHPYHMEE